MEDKDKMKMLMQAMMKKTLGGAGSLKEEDVKGYSDDSSKPVSNEEMMNLSSPATGTDKGGGITVEDMDKFRKKKKGLVE